jgi:hypothetical protein
MQNAYTSHVLYHLVGRQCPTDDERNFGTLRAILSSMEVRTNRVGHHVGGATISIDPDRGLVDGEPIAQTVVCFCDIPFSALGLHTSKYGRFGVGVDRLAVAEQGARPVIYIPVVSHNNPSLNNYVCLEGMNAWQGLREHFPPPPNKSQSVVGAKPSDATTSVHLATRFIAREFLAYVKTFDIGLPEHHPANYYMEREWRRPANLSLHLTLREIIAPAAYHDRIKAEFPQLAGMPVRVAPAREQAASGD